MPRILALQPSELVTVDLTHFSCRIGIQATTWKQKPCFSLVYRFHPPQTLAFRPDGLLVQVPILFTPLAQVPVLVTNDTVAKDIEPVAEVCLEGGTFEKDSARTTEAYNLFRNQRVGEERLQTCVNDSIEVLRAYWAIREWWAEGMASEKKIQVNSTTLMLRP